MLAWWMAFYYPVMLLLIFVGYRLGLHRWRSRRTDVALGCVFICLVLFPMLVHVAMIGTGLFHRGGG
jgi:hypothetical protein